MIKTITFGYLPKKWKRLIRVPFIFWVGFLGYLFIMHTIYDNKNNVRDMLYVLLISVGVFFTISYILEPFVVKDKD